MFTFRNTFDKKYQISIIIIIRKYIMYYIIKTQTNRKHDFHNIMLPFLVGPNTSAL